MTAKELSVVLAKLPDAEVNFCVAESWGDLNNINLEKVEVKTTVLADGSTSDTVTIRLREVRENETE